LELTCSSSTVGHRASSVGPVAAPPSPPPNMLHHLRWTSYCICSSSIVHPPPAARAAHSPSPSFSASVSMAYVRQRNEIRRSAGSGLVHVLQFTSFSLTKSFGCWVGGEWAERATNAEAHLLSLSLFFFFFFLSLIDIFYSYFYK
jgi:hypothetical protein